MRRTLVLVVGVLGLMAVGVGVAWAQHAQAGITSVSPDSPAPGEVITVTGHEFDADATIELRWGDREGPVIGSTTADESG